MELIRKDPKLEDLYYGGSIAGVPPSVVKGFIKSVARLILAKNINDVYGWKGFHLEKLRGKLLGKMSIKLNKSRRLVFSLLELGNLQGIAIEGINNHYAK